MKTSVSSKMAEGSAPFFSMQKSGKAVAPFFAPAPPSNFFFDTGMTGIADHTLTSSQRVGSDKASQPFFHGIGEKAPNLSAKLQTKGKGKANISPIGRSQNEIVQRLVRTGTDHGGCYEFDDHDCTLNYHQNWFFRFNTTQTSAERQSYMDAARDQIHDVWSGKYPLIPNASNCPCPGTGVAVTVTPHMFERNRQGRGFSVVVSPEEERGFTNQPLRHIDLGTSHEEPLNMGDGLTQRRIAHEFGHTIGLTDEYVGWARFFSTRGSRDRPSIMHSGDEVRPRHYQPFADSLDYIVGNNCIYSPGGIRQRQFAVPVDRFSSFPTMVDPRSADFVIGLNYDRRISNEAWLGLVYPTLGAMSVWDPRDRSVRTGPTAGLTLNQLAHPLYVNVRTGLLFDPAHPGAALDVPISVDLGFQGEGFRAGANYTGIANILGSGGWTHLVGVGLSVDLPWLEGGGR